MDYRGSFSVSERCWGGEANRRKISLGVEGRRFVWIIERVNFAAKEVSERVYGVKMVTAHLSLEMGTREGLDTSS